jgi:hypothetical protein
MRAAAWSDRIAMRHELGLSSLLLAGACTTAPEPNPFDDGTGALDTAAADETDAAEDDDAPPGTDSGATDPSPPADDGDSDGAHFDLGAPPDLGPIDEPEACELVDLVFVIDNSGSMSGEQQNLVDSFPGFVDGMLGSLDKVQSLHVGVVPTDENTDNTPPCDTMGAFVTRSTSGAACGPYTGGTFMTQDDPLDQTFECAAHLGTGGSGNERPMDALRLAIGDIHLAPGGCNEDFLRSDALLVVVVISDEEDDHESALGNSQGDPEDWFADVIATKQDIESNVVVLSLVGQNPLGDCETTPFDPHSESSEPGIRLMEWTEMFTYGFIGDVCAEDYAPFFEEAIAVIDEACTNFTPPAG